MILVDSSVWIDHVRVRDDILLNLLQNSRVLTHAFVIGEIALGHVHRRKLVLEQLHSLPRTKLAADGEVLEFINHRKLAGSGVGYVDAHLLASTMLTVGASLWTHDKRLRVVAQRLGLAADRP